MALAKDESTGAGRGRVVDAKRDGQAVIYRSDFDTGFDNWTDHWDNYRPWAPLSLTSHAAMVGSRSLMLSTSEGAYTAGSVANTSAAFRRMSIFTDHRYHSFSAFVGVGSGGFSGSWGEFSLVFDIQSYDNTVRSLYRLACNVQTAPDYSVWRIEKDDGTQATIPGSAHLKAGDNDNKINFTYVRLTIDMQANGGLGGYHEAQIGPESFSLTGLGAGSAIEPAQTTGDNIAEFNGGCNIGFTLARNVGVAGGCQLFADDIVYSLSNQG